MEPFGLTCAQRVLYDALPEHLRDSFVAELPWRGGRKRTHPTDEERKATALEANANLLESIADVLMAAFEVRMDTAKALRVGKLQPSEVDLRKMCAPPVLPLGANGLPVATLRFAVPGRKRKPRVVGA